MPLCYYRVNRGQNLPGKNGHIEAENKLHLPETPAAAAVSQLIFKISELSHCYYSAVKQLCMAPLLMCTRVHFCCCRFILVYPEYINLVKSLK